MFDAGNDGCLSIFRDVYATGTLVFPVEAHVLEVGCAEADWMTPMLGLRPDLHMTGIDWRACTRPQTCLQGDVLRHDFPAESFDVVVGISSIEHIGLGHYEADPLDAEGDVHCMERVVRWLKPGGWVYLDVPFGEAYRVVDTSHRLYDAESFQRRLVPAGLTVRRSWYSTAQYGEVPTETVPTSHDRMWYRAALLTKES